MALLKFLIPLLFILFSFAEIGRIPIQNGISFNLTDLSVVVLISFWFIKIKKRNHLLTFPIIMFVLACIFSLLVNLATYQFSESITSSLYLVRWVFYAMLYFVFADIGKSNKIKINNWILISGIIILILGFIQFVLYPNLRNLYYLGWDEHLYRMFSTFLDPNFLGVILVSFFVFFFILKDKLFMNNTILTYLVLIFTFIGIVLTYSRGALLMFSMSVLAYSIIKKKLKYVVGTIILFVVLFIILSPRFYLENTNLLRTSSLNQRLQNSKEALGIYSKNPFFGVGFNNLRYAREKYGLYDTSSVGLSHSGAGVDNSFIFVLVTSGIPGFMAYLFLLYKMFKLGFLKIKNRYGLILVVSLVGLIFNAQFINSMFYSFVMIWVWILAGLTESN